MKLEIDIPEDIYNECKFRKDLLSLEGEPTDLTFNMRIETIIANGIPLSKFLEELERKILMEVDGGTGDMYLRYTDICDRISNSIDEYKAESEELKGESNDLS